MPAFYLNLLDQPLLTLAPFSNLKKSMHLEYLQFLHQTHSDQGTVIGKKNIEALRPFKQNGDFLVTNVSHVGIGVMTADCLPIVLHDRLANVVAVVHAGWRGAVIGVAVKALERMREEYGTDPQNVVVFFGPSAKACCYKVGDDFESSLAGFAYSDKVMQKHGDNWYFDLPGFNRLQLEAAGIKKEAFHLNYNYCTMCDHSFYSYRRQGEQAGRQMTVVCLR